jgi:hypothetical protein
MRVTGVRTDYWGFVRITGVHAGYWGSYGLLEFVRLAGVRAVTGVRAGCYGFVRFILEFMCFIVVPAICWFIVSHTPITSAQKKAAPSQHTAADETAHTDDRLRHRFLSLSRHFAEEPNELVMLAQRFLVNQIQLAIVQPAECGGHFLVVMGPVEGFKNIHTGGPP